MVAVPLAGATQVVITEAVRGDRCERQLTASFAGDRPVRPFHGKVRESPVLVDEHIEPPAVSGTTHGRSHQEGREFAAMIVGHRGGFPRAHILAGAARGLDHHGERLLARRRAMHGPAHPSQVHPRGPALEP